MPELEGVPRPTAYLIHAESPDRADLLTIAEDNDLELVAWGEHDSIPREARVLAYLDDGHVRELLPRAMDSGWALGILAHPGVRLLSTVLGVQSSLRQAVRHYLEATPIKVDILTCNDELVLSAVIVGEGFVRDAHDGSRPPSRFSRIMTALRAIRYLRLRGYRVTTGKGRKLQLPALGLLVTKNPRSSFLAASFADLLSYTDGRFTLLAISPRSLLSYLWLLLRIHLPGKIKSTHLPRSIGLMRNQELLLEDDKGIDYLLDGSPRHATTLDFRICEQQANMLPGVRLDRDASTQPKVDKDNIRIDHLPQADAAELLVGAPLPFFNRAGEEEHRDLFVALRGSAALTSPYLVLMVLSTLLALTGLYANSAPVIIGAMILAPLMSPIVSLAMGLARTEMQLIRNAMRTLAFGVAAGLGCAITFSWLMPIENFTAEMQSRISPSLLDLAVAVLSGIAGAYAHAKEEIAKSLAGVAISVALVPPLSVAGIGIGWADWDMAAGAFLLFATNIVGISLAATATFLVLGFAPFRLARRGLTISLVLMAVITVPLYYTFANVVERARILKQIPTGQFELEGLQVQLRDVSVRVGRSTPVVRVGMSSSQRIDEQHVEALKDLISERIGGPVFLEAEFYLRR